MDIQIKFLAASGRVFWVWLAFSALCFAVMPTDTTPRSLAEAYPLLSLPMISTAASLLFAVVGLAVYAVVLIISTVVRRARRGES